MALELEMCDQKFPFPTTLSNQIESLFLRAMLVSPKNKLIFLLGVCFPLFFACTPRAQKVEEEKKTSYRVPNPFQPLQSQQKDSLSKVVAQCVKSWVDTNNFSGGILVQKNGETLYSCYKGFSSFKHKRNITKQTALHLASVSKVITATAILRLKDQGLIRLDQPVKDFLPTFPYNDISIRMLMNHRSGLQKYEYFTYQDGMWNPSVQLRNDDILFLLNKFALPTYFVPDTKFAYCNTNFAILALVIEELTQLSFEEALKELIFKPLGMWHAFVFNIERDRYRRSQNYKGAYQKQPLLFLDGVYGDKNIYATPEDLARFSVAFYDTSFLSFSSRDEMLQGYSYERKGANNYGLGIRMKEWEGYPNLYYHYGWWHGNTATFIHLPQDSVVIIALSNKYNRSIYQLSKLAAIFDTYPFYPNKGAGVFEEEME